jgi:hypothetical protein
MSDEPTVKYVTAPTLSLNMPDCSACCVAVEWEDGYICRQCGTTWSHDAGDGDVGELYESWSGEVLDIPATDPEQAWLTTIDHERTRLAKERVEQNARALRVQAERAAEEAAARATLWAVPVADLPESQCCGEQLRVTEANDLVCSACGAVDTTSARSILRGIEAKRRKVERDIHRAVVVEARNIAAARAEDTAESRATRG